MIFTDFEGFSQLTKHLKAAEVIRRLDTYFTEFDRISAKYGLEKIKTIGDSTWPSPACPRSTKTPSAPRATPPSNSSSPSDRISAMIGPDGWNIRIGIHTGPLVAGVIGRQKFSYDVWGDTVNFASRMESSGAPGRINVSTEIYQRVEPHYRWEPRGPQPVKHLGKAEMYFLLGKR